MAAGEIRVSVYAMHLIQQRPRENQYHFSFRGRSVRGMMKFTTELCISETSVIYVDTQLTFFSLLLPFISTCMQLHLHAARNIALAYNDAIADARNVASEDSRETSGQLFLMSHCILPCVAIKVNSPQRSRRVAPFWGP